MPEFQLDTTGTIRDVRAPSVEAVKRVDLDFSDLDSFTQSYVEAMFFTETGTGDDGDMADVGFSDLAPETLAQIVADCDKFRRDTAATENAMVGERSWQASSSDVYCEAAGRDFWYTRNGHGCGFWDGGWPEPHASALDKAAKAFLSVDLYRGDDGKLYLA